MTMTAMMSRAPAAPPATPPIKAIEEEAIGGEYSLVVYLIYIDLHRDGSSGPVEEAFVLVDVVGEEYLVAAVVDLVFVVVVVFVDVVDDVGDGTQTPP